MKSFRRGIALAMGVLMIAALAACQPPSTNPSTVASCAPSAPPPAASLAYSIHSEYQPPTSAAAVVRDTAATTGQIPSVDGDSTAGADLCVTVNVDATTHVSTIVVGLLSTAPATYPVLVEAHITISGISYILGYDSRQGTAPLSFTGTTTGLKTDFQTTTPGSTLDVIGQASSNEFSGTYIPVPATGEIEFGLDATGISLNQVASAPIVALTGVRYPTRTGLTLRM